MKVYIAKHYWKNGENATWESHEKIDKKIFEYLKRNYHNFVNNRPLMIEERKHYIYLCYEDAVDVFDRKITNITFFISKYKVNESLCSKAYHHLELSLPNKQQVNFFLKLFVLVVGILFIYNIFFNHENKENEIDKSETPKIIQDVNKSTIPSKKEDKSPEKKKLNVEVIEIDKGLKKDKTVTTKKEDNKTLKEELNKDIKNELQDFNLSIKKYEDFMSIKNKLTTIKGKIKGKESLVNLDNKSKVSKLEEIDTNYTNLMNNGLKCEVVVIKNKKKVKFKTLFFDKKTIKIIQKKKYKIHIVTKLKNDIVNGILKIKEIELIQLFNGEAIKIEIDKGYFLKLEKIKGDDNESRRKK